MTPEELRRLIVQQEGRLFKALVSGLAYIDLGYTVDAARSNGQTPQNRAELASTHARELERPSTEAVVPSEPRWNRAGHFSDIGRLFDELDTQRLVICGDGGSGKTVLAIELELHEDQIRSESAPDKSDGSLLIRLDAPTWRHHRSLDDWFAERLRDGYGLTQLEADSIVRDHRVIPLIDGLDEMDVDGGELTNASALMGMLNDYGIPGKAAPVVVVCRSSCYEQLRRIGAGLHSGSVVWVGDLDLDMLRRYVFNRYADRSPSSWAYWNELIDDLENPDWVAAKEVLTAPWYLFLAIVAFDQGRNLRGMLTGDPDEAPEVSKKRIIEALLDAFIPAICARSRKLDERSYRPEKVQKWLTSLACHLRWQAGHVARRPGMTSIDISPHLLWPIGGRKLVRAFHVLASLVVGGIVSAALLFLLGQSSAELLRGLLTETGACCAPAGGIALIAVEVLGIPVYVAVIGSHPWPAPRFSPRRMMRGFDDRSYRHWFTIIATGVISSAFALTFASMLLSKFQIENQTLIQFVFSGVCALLFCGRAVHITSNTWIPSANATSPMEAIRKDLRAAARQGISFGLVGALAYGSVGGWLCGIVGGFATLLITCWGRSSAANRYLIGVGVAALRGRLPWRLGAFLDWALETQVLRRSGATYQFRHRSAQDWFASRICAVDECRGSCGSPRTR